MEKNMSEISQEETRIWAYLVKNKLATAKQVALNCDVSEQAAQSCIDRIGTPNQVFIEEATRHSQPTLDDAAMRLLFPELMEKVAPSIKSTRVQTLETAIALTGGDRNKSYGPPFDNMSDCAALWNAYVNSKQACIVRTVDSYEVKFTAEDVAWLMTLVKMTRTFQSGYHPDNYTDAAAYSAIAGECREIQMEKGSN
jgi:hypothetical protein